MILYSVGITFFYFIALGTAYKLIGPGIWQVTKIMECPDEYPFKLGVSTKKINRTHDAIEAHFDFPDTLDENIGFRVEICKHVDGGCKPYRVMTYTSLEDASYRWAKNNTEYIMEQAGIDPPQFPVMPGKYELNNYIFNYKELPKKATYGTFDAKFFITKLIDNVGCINVLYEFTEDEEE